MLDIGAVSEENIELFSQSTRDRDIPVHIDAKSKVIFIQDFYVGDAEYVDAGYRDSYADDDDKSDTDRRVREHFELYSGKRILDFGFGGGSFLKAVLPKVRACAGVELEERGKDFSRRTGIETHSSIEKLSFVPDVIFAFHVLEHLPDPLGWLGAMRDALPQGGGTIVIEVPHALDFLLASLAVPEFKNYTLWSQHLVLHTRESLSRLLSHAGFDVKEIYGVQRYGISNHFGWLSRRQPGSHHVAPFNGLKNEVLDSAYEAALAASDSTDTLVLVATT